MPDIPDSADPQLEPTSADAAQDILTKLDDILSQLKDVGEWLETVDVRIRDIEENRF